MKGVIRMGICLVMMLFTYAFPIFIYPVGTYKGSETVLGQKLEYSISFHFDGTMDTNILGLNGKTDYKLNGKEIYLGVINDKAALVKLDIVNCYTVRLDLGGGVYFQMTNTWGIVFTVIYGLIGLWGVFAAFQGMVNKSKKDDLKSSK